MLKPYYSDEFCEIYHGDCREVVPQMAGPWDLVIADPPYGIGFRPPSGKGRLCNMSAFPPIRGDDKPFDPTPWLGYPKVILWGANHYASRLPDSPSWFYWDKRAPGIRPNDNADGELAWSNLGGPLRIFRYLWMGAMKAGEKDSKRVHPNQKPEALMRWCIERADVNPGAWVLVPYMGSGTTLRAAKDMGVKAVGVEIEEHFCEVAARRLEQGVLFGSGL